VCIEMTLLSHALLQNEPFSQIIAGLGTNKTSDRKKLASGGPVGLRSALLFFRPLPVGCQPDRRSRMTLATVAGFLSR
jgi:hypothetical protein